MVTTRQRILVTRNGVPAVWMISYEDFESIMETLDVLADAAAMRDVDTATETNAEVTMDDILAARDEERR